MKACLLRAAAKVETNPLEYADIPMPEPGEGEVLVRIRACGVCRTDLHVIEGELPSSLDIRWLGRSRSRATIPCGS